MVGTLQRLPVINRRKGGMTSSQHGLYVWGYRRPTMAGANRRTTVRLRESAEAVLSWDCRLQLACMKLESLVIADQHAAVNTFPGLVHTARHITKAGCTRSRHTNPQGREAPKVWSVIGVKS